jgi:uncharacterized protein with GYD domain
MALDIVLVNFTDQGIRNVKDSPQRANAFREMCKKNEVRVRDVFWTMGRYDMLAVIEGPDEAMAAVLLTMGKLGNVRTETLRAMDAETFQRILQKVG